MNIKKRTEDLKAEDNNLEAIREKLTSIGYDQINVNDIMCDVFELKRFHNSTAKKRYERSFIKAFELVAETKE